MALHALRLNHNYLTRDGELIVLVLVYIRCTTLCWKNMPQLLILLFQHCDHLSFKKSAYGVLPIGAEAVNNREQKKRRTGRKRTLMPPPPTHTLF